MRHSGTPQNTGIIITGNNKKRPRASSLFLSPHSKGGERYDQHSKGHSNSFESWNQVLKSYLNGLGNIHTQVAGVSHTEKRRRSLCMFANIFEPRSGGTYPIFRTVNLVGGVHHLLRLKDTETAGFLCLLDQREHPYRKLRL